MRSTMVSRVPWPLAILALGSCGPGKSDSPCENACVPGTICIPSVGACAPLCQRDADCPDGMKCEENGICDRGALSSSDTGRIEVPAEGWTLTKADSPHIFLLDLHVPAGAVLTVEAGATVLLPAWHNIFVDGSLKVLGTTSEPVTFGAYEGTRWGSIYLVGEAASVFDYAIVDNGGVTVRAGLSSMTHVDFRNSWLSVGELDTFTLDADNFVANNQVDGYVALTAVDIKNLTIRNSSLQNVIRSFFYRNFDTNQAALNIEANTIGNIDGAGLEIDLGAATTVTIQGNYIQTTDAQGIYVSGSMAPATLVLNGNRIANTGSYGVQISTPGAVDLSVAKLPGGAATAVPGGVDSAYVGDCYGTCISVGAGQGGTLRLSDVVIDGAASDGIALDTRNAAVIIDGQRLNLQQVSGTPFTVTTRDQPAAVTLDSITAVGPGTLGDGIRVTNTAGGSVSITNATVSDLEGSAINVSMNQDGSAAVGNVAIARVRGHGVRVYSVAALTSVTLSGTNTIDSAEGYGVYIDGRKGLTLDATGSTTIQNTTSAGLWAQSYLDLSANVAGVSVTNCTSDAIGLSARGTLTAMVSTPMVNGFMGRGVYSSSWGINDTQVLGTAGTHAVIKNGSDWAVYISSRTQAKGTVHYVDATSLNGPGIGVVQSDMLSTLPAVCVDFSNNLVEDVRSTALRVQAEAPIYAYAGCMTGSTAMSIANNTIKNAQDNGIHVNSRLGVRDVVIDANAIGDAAATGWDVGGYGVMVESYRDRVSATLSNNVVSRTLGTGLRVYSIIADTAGGYPDTTVTGNVVKNGNSTGIDVRAWKAVLSNNLVEKNNGTGLAFTTVHLPSSPAVTAPNLTVTDDSYLRNDGYGVAVSDTTWGVLTRVRANENNNVGIRTNAGPSYLEIDGSQAIANASHGIYFSGSYDRPSWGRVDNTCVGENGGRGIFYERNSIIATTDVDDVAPVARRSPRVRQSCVFNNGDQGVYGIGPEPEHWYTTAVDTSVVFENGNYGVAYLGNVSGSYIANNVGTAVAASGGPAGTCYVIPPAATPRLLSGASFSSNNCYNVGGCYGTFAASAAAVALTTIWDGLSTPPLRCAPDADSSLPANLGVTACGL